MPDRKKPLARVVIPLVLGIAFSTLLAVSLVMAQRGNPFAFDLAMAAVLIGSIIGFLVYGQKRLKAEDELEARIQAETARAVFGASLAIATVASWIFISLFIHKIWKEGMLVGVAISGCTLGMMFLQGIAGFFVRRKYSGK